jgi:hypothetical protein
MYGFDVGRRPELERRAEQEGILSLRKRLLLVTGTLPSDFSLLLSLAALGTTTNLQMAGATAERASDLYLAAGRGVDCGDCRIGKGAPTI